ncbi:MAG: AraC family ligand binding domain-containing protein [Acidimicrobiales bacterium]
MTAQNKNARIFLTQESPPRLPSLGVSPQVEILDLGCPVGIVKWQISLLGPDFSHGMHRTDTYDFDIVLAGRGTLVLEDATHDIGPGDLIVLTGILHTWRAEAGGLTLSVTSIGTGG